MKAILAIVAGFATTAAVFASGVVVAMMILPAGSDEGPDAKAENVAAVWTGVPRRVERGARGLERVASRLPEDAVAVSGAGTEVPAPGGLIAAAHAGEGDIDPVVTASMTPDGMDHGNSAGAGDDMRIAHVGWCAERYRSYRVEDNSYQPFGGGRRPCTSPYLDELVVDDGDGQMLFASVEWREQDLVEHAPAHVRDCFSRYRSYRVEDNSYQPYGGGPRRQCD